MKCIRMIIFLALGVYMFSIVWPRSTVTREATSTALKPTINPPSCPSCKKSKPGLQKNQSSFPPKCFDMFTIDKGGPGGYWDSDAKYEGLSHNLDPLLRAIEVGDMAHTNRSSILAYPHTRLSLMQETIPYLPCKVREYGAADIRRCLSARSSRGAPTWITFIGDSNQRQKTHSFISFLPHHLNYSFYLGKKEVDLSEFIKAVAEHESRPPTFDIIGRSYSTSQPQTSTPLSTSQSLNPSISQPTSLSTSQPVNLVTKTFLSTPQPTEINPSTPQPHINPSTHQPISFSTSQPVNLVTKTFLSTPQPTEINPSTPQSQISTPFSTSQPINLSTSQPINLSTLPLHLTNPHFPQPGRYHQNFINGTQVNGIRYSLYELQNPKDDNENEEKYEKISKEKHNSRNRTNNLDIDQENIKSYKYNTEQNFDQEQNNEKNREQPDFERENIEKNREQSNYNTENINKNREQSHFNQENKKNNHEYRTEHNFNQEQNNEKNSEQSKSNQENIKKSNEYNTEQNLNQEQNNEKNSEQSNTNEQNYDSEKSNHNNENHKKPKYRSKNDNRFKRRKKIHSFVNKGDDSDIYQSLNEDEIPYKDYELRVTLVWAPSGSELGHPTTREGHKVTKIHDLASAEVVPDVIIIGFGTWMLLMRDFDDELVPFTEMDLLTRPILEPLKKLASRTTMLYWTQSRYHWFSYENMNNLIDDREEWWNKFLMMNQFKDAMNILDYWLWHLIKDTGAFYWDSTLPFNLANLRECFKIYQAGLQKHPLYYDRWWNCFDVHHASYETNNVEIQMLLNLLCNKDMNLQGDYCCTSD